MSVPAILFLVVVAAAYGFMFGVIWTLWWTDERRGADKPPRPK